MWHISYKVPFQQKFSKQKCISSQAFKTYFGGTSLVFLPLAFIYSHSLCSWVAKVVLLHKQFVHFNGYNIVENMASSKLHLPSSSFIVPLFTISLDLASELLSLRQRSFGWSGVDLDCNLNPVMLRSNLLYYWDDMSDFCRSLQSTEAKRLCRCMTLPARAPGTASSHIDNLPIDTSWSHAAL